MAVLMKQVGSAVGSQNIYIQCMSTGHRAMDPTRNQTYRQTELYIKPLILACCQNPTRIHILMLYTPLGVCIIQDLGVQGGGGRVIFSPLENTHLLSSGVYQLVLQYLYPNPNRQATVYFLLDRVSIKI